MTERKAKQIVLEKYKYRCDMCFITIGKPEVHHLRDKTTHPRLAAKVWNLVPLCHKHHIGFHIWNGGTQAPCTEKDYRRWKRKKQRDFQIRFGLLLLIIILFYEAFSIMTIK